MANRSSESMKVTRVILAFCLACLLVSDASATVGVNLGQVADNLLPPSEILLLVQSTTITKVKLFGADPAILNAFAGSGIEIVIGAGNDQVVPLAQTPGYALQWVNTNVVAYPKTTITAIALGNEVLAYAANVAPQLLPAMQNLHAALVSVGLDKQVKVGTPSALSVLEYSAPPSNASFRSWEGSILGPIMPFLVSTGAPFMVNAYPYFAYTGDPQNTSLNFCLFQPNASETRFDNVTGITYTSMWDAQLDALYTAIAKMGFTNVSVAVTETGWPHAGDLYEIGPAWLSAKTFNGNLIKRLVANAGTPLRPGVPIDTYIFDLFDEDLKVGAGSEKHFGLFYANGSPVYDVGIIPALDPPVAALAPPPPSQSPSTVGTLNIPPPPGIFPPPPLAGLVSPRDSLLWSSPPPAIFPSPPPPGLVTPPPAIFPSPPPPGLVTPPPAIFPSPPPPGLVTPPPVIFPSQPPPLGFAPPPPPGFVFPPPPPPGTLDPPPPPLFFVSPPPPPPTPYVAPNFNPYVPPPPGAPSYASPRFPISATSLFTFLLLQALFQHLLVF
ncbi:unnamed protein product [Calypogeia fissa]